MVVQNRAEALQDEDWKPACQLIITLWQSIEKECVEMGNNIRLEIEDLMMEAKKIESLAFVLDESLSNSEYDDPTAYAGAATVLYYLASEHLKKLTEINA